MLGVRPLFRFFGSKWSLAPKYPPPAHDLIVEPFAGSAGYSTRYCDRQVILVERDPTIAGLWSWLIRADSAEILSLPLLAPDEPIPASVVGPARALIGFWATMTAAKPQSKMTPSSAQVPASYWGEAIRARTAENIARIRHWIVIQGDFSDAPDVEATWFIDPPYQPENRTKGRGRVDAYAAGTPDFADVAQFVLSRRGRVIVCENVGADWLPFVPFVSGHASPRKQRLDAGKGCKTHEAILAYDTKPGSAECSVLLA